MITERDIMVPMRDGVRIAVDVYRPDTDQPLPVLYACALHNKDMQGPNMSDVLPPQPAYSSLWFGPLEAGDTGRLLAAGYVHVIAQSRGTGKSEGRFMDEDPDQYDPIDWIGRHPRARGNVGLVVSSGDPAEQGRGP